MKSFLEINMDYMNQLPGAAEKTGAEAVDDKSGNEKTGAEAVEVTSGNEIIGATEITGPDAIADTGNTRRARNRAKAALCAAVAAALLSILITGAFSEKPYSMFGYSWFSVLTENLQSEIPAGALIIVKEADQGGIRIGDDVTYAKGADIIATGSVADIYENYGDGGARVFLIGGSGNPPYGGETVYAEDVIGAVALSVPILGAILARISDNILFAFLFLGGTIIAAFVCNRLINRHKLLQNPV